MLVIANIGQINNVETCVDVHCVETWLWFKQAFLRSACNACQIARIIADIVCWGLGGWRNCYMVGVISATQSASILYLYNVKLLRNKGTTTCMLVLAVHTGTTQRVAA